VLVTSSFSTMIQKYRTQGAFGHVLDLGPGWAWPGLDWLADPDTQVTGLGYAGDQQAAAQAAVRKLQAQRRAEYRTNGLESFPMPDRSVDTVVSFGSMRAWPDPLRVLDEAARVLKTGGLFAIGDVRAGAGWWQHWLSAMFSSRRLRPIYRQERAGIAPDRFRELAQQCSLPENVVETAGPDLWIVRRLG